MLSAPALAALLPPDVDLDGPLRHEAARPVWIGMVWGRLDRGDLAWAWFDRVGLPELQAWIGAERGRLHRELGRHARAEEIEWRALVRADDPVDAAMLRISLAADAVGHGDVEAATSRMHAARQAVGALQDGPRAARERLRLSWVEVEVAWLRGAPPPTDALPVWDEGFGAPRFPPDHAAGTTFHAAKGLLFAGVVRRDLRLLEAAAPCPQRRRRARCGGRGQGGRGGGRPTRGALERPRVGVLRPFAAPGTRTLLLDSRVKVAVVGAVEAAAEPVAAVAATTVDAVGGRSDVPERGEGVLPSVLSTDGVEGAWTCA